MLWIAAGVVVVLASLASTTGAMPVIDHSLHDTYYVVAHHHSTVVWGLACAVFAAAYWALDVKRGPTYPRFLAWTHLGLTALGVVVALSPGPALLLAIPPIRWADDNPVALFRLWNTVVSVGYALILLGLAPFAAVMFLALAGRHRRSV